MYREFGQKSCNGATAIKARLHMSRALKRFGAALLVALIGVGLVFAISKDARKGAQIAALDKIGDAATKKMSSMGDAAESSVAADFINIPIEVREISDGIFQATGVANTHLISTLDGHVLFDTGLATQVAKQMKALNAAVPDGDVTHIIVSHSHADHSGGVKAWNNGKAEIIAHAEFAEEQRYLTELQDYFWHRNRTLFPFMPEKPPTLGLVAYGGIKPTIGVANGQPFKFSQGEVDFEVHALPGAEGADNIVLWLPQKKILFSGDFFGPLFPQFPNIFTMRGEKIRKPVEYIQSLDAIIALDPDMIVPSHKTPISDKAFIMNSLVKMRDATRFVHDATIEGMNAGKTVHELMAEIQLPAHLDLSQEHGRVSWAVKSIWEYYATWFHFDKTAELYPVPATDIYTDLVQVAGPEPLIAKASVHVAENRPVHSLHILDVVLGAQPDNKAALKVRRKALLALLADAKSGLNNSYEIYWLNYRLRDTDARLAK
jgi:alkyl sulfatase BDS1-like metallo-beta-lactamase superfamily hydrolase